MNKKGEFASSDMFEIIKIAIIMIIGYIIIKALLGVA
jgi:hypothetical protein